MAGENAIRSKVKRALRQPSNGALRWSLFRPGETGSEHRDSIIFVVLFAVCIAASHWCVARFGTIFVWPANGVLVAALLLLHRPAALRVLIVCGAVNLLGNFLRDSPAHMIVIGTALNLAESIAAAAIARRFCGAGLDLRRPRRLTAFVVLAVAPTCAVAALIGIAALRVPLHEFAVGWQTWFAADALGLIIVTPLLVLAAAHRRENAGRPTRLVEPCLLLGLVTVITLAIFLQSRAPLEFLIFLPVLLIAFRLSPIWSALAILIVATIGTVATLSGHGPMTLGVLGPVEWANAQTLRALQTLPTFQLFMMALIAVALPATTVLTERRLMAGRLRARTAAAIAARQHIAHLAAHDADSGLPNRTGLMQTLERSASGGATVFVAALSVDRFARIRAAIGSVEAARLLARIAKRLAASLPGERVALLSSDTIGLQMQCADEASAEQRLRAALAAFDVPMMVADAEVDVGLTAGLARVEGAARGIDRAMIALDQARLASVPLAWFDADTERVAAGGLAMLSVLRTSLIDGSLWLAHQPKLDLKNGRVAGVECLIRWDRPGHGRVRPDAFMPLVEETRFIEPLTDWVLGRALSDQAALAARGISVGMAINLSARSLGEPSLVARFAAILAEKAARAEDITLEITETAIMGDPETALASLNALKRLGFGIAIDDYGTGLSSLSYLRNIPADSLKIDRCFIAGMADGPRHVELVRATIDLGHRLGLKVVAEGVETEEQLALLSLLGCDQAQGYLIAQPCPVAEIDSAAIAVWTRHVSAPDDDIACAVGG